VELEVEKGYIAKCSLTDSGSRTDKAAEILNANQYGDTTGPDSLSGLSPDNIPNLKALAESLTGEPHDPEKLGEIISSKNLVKPEWIDIFVDGLF
ncbi:MAG: hypothetical protein KAT15_10325, partial [Bacteroidales bacterium]|nr:hypothetical protein [Bacteroidales bacterium]